MIRGIGIDIVHANRMARWIDDPELLDRYFHPEELASVHRKGKTAILSLAARFAAKEAFGKALGTGLRGIRLRDIRVTNDDNGKPHIQLSETARDALNRVGGGVIHLSLTHERENAVAMVVIEGEMP